jgi:hypothetical protein
MGVFKDKNKTWYVSIRYADWMGQKKRKLKRGFKTKKEAVEWERDFMLNKKSDLNMSFGKFVDIYCKDMQSRLKQNTWLTKQAIIEKKILPYFKDKKINEIMPKCIFRYT